jgi:hypothetical protein
MCFGNLVLSAATAATVLTYSGLGATFGNLAAVVLGKSAEERANWAAVGGAIGCVLAFLTMAWSLVTVTRL